LQIAADEQPDAIELDVGNRRRLAVERDDVDDAGALEDRQRVGRVEAREAVAGKQRPVDLLLAILPAAPAGDRRQERLDLLAFELVADDLLVARARPDREPLRAARSLVMAAPALPAASALLERLLHVLVLPLDDRLRAQLLEYFWNSPCACR
jgi:hypothetical protein